MSFKKCFEVGKPDPPLEYFNNFMDKHKAMVPEDWKGGWDHDKKLEPPEIEFVDSEYENEAD